MKDEKIIERIKKLLRLAEDNSSPNEAMIAAKRARSLMDQHQISKEDLLDSETAEFSQEIADKKTAVRETWVRHLAAAVAHLNDCQSIMRGGRFGNEVQYIFRGFSADAILARSVFDYLVECCNRGLEQSETKGRSNRNFYRVAFAETVLYRVLEIVDQRKKVFAEETGTDLVLCKLQLVKDHFEDVPDAPPIQQREPTEEEMKAVRAGHEHGRSVGLDPQIDESKKTELIS